jgi:tetratricopeptide (TPR) repeat protein
MHTHKLGRYCVSLILIYGVLFTGKAWSAGDGGGRGRGAGGGQDPYFKSLIQTVNKNLRDGNFPEAEKSARELYENYGQGGNIKRELFDMPGVGGATVKADQAHLWLGKVLYEEGRFSEAESFFRLALPLATKFSGKKIEPKINTLFMLGRTLVPQGKYAEAVQMLRDALKANEDAYGINNPESNKLRNVLGGVLRQVGQHGEAEEVLKKALVNSKDTQEKKYLWHRSSTLFHLAGTLTDAGRNREAENYARQALELREKILGVNHSDTAKTLGLLGRIITKEGRQGEAREMLERALPILSKSLGNHHIETTRAELGLALINAKEGKTIEADKNFRRAITGSQQSGEPKLYANYSGQYAKFLLQQKRPEEALLIYRGAIESLDLVFANTRGLSDDVRENFSAQYAPFYTEMLQLLVRLHEAAPDKGYDREALSVISRTQSRLFTELLRQADVKKVSSDSDFLGRTQKLKSLQAQLDTLNRAKSASGAREELQSTDNDDENESDEKPVAVDRSSNLDRQISQIKKEIALVEDGLWQKYPRFMELSRPKPVTVEDLQQKLLKPDEAVVTYALLPEKTAIFVVKRDVFKMVVVPQGRAQIAKLVRAVREPEEQASSTGLLTALKALDPEKLNSLYKSLVQPVEESFKDVSRVIVIGDGPIYTLPLEMLVTRYGEPDRQLFAATRKENKAMLGEFATLSYLGSQYRFAYLPSLAALYSQRFYPKPPVKYDRELVSFADPIFENEKGKAYGENTRSLLTELSQNVRGKGAMVSIPRLPETADEARSIAKIVGGKFDLYLRENAQEGVVKKQDLKNVRFLHFATHGFLGGEFLQVKESARGASSDESGKQRSLTRIKTPAETAAQQASAEKDPVIIPDAPKKGGQPALALTLVGDLKGEDGLLTMGEVIEDLNLNAQLA